MTEPNPETELAYALTAARLANSLCKAGIPETIAARVAVLAGTAAAAAAPGDDPESQAAAIAAGRADAAEARRASEASTLAFR